MFTAKADKKNKNDVSEKILFELRKKGSFHIETGKLVPQDRYTCTIFFI